MVLIIIEKSPLHACGIFRPAGGTVSISAKNRPILGHPRDLPLPSNECVWLLIFRLREADTVAKAIQFLRVSIHPERLEEFF